MYTYCNIYVTHSTHMECIKRYVPDLSASSSVIPLYFVPTKMTNFLKISLISLRTMSLRRISGSVSNGMCSSMYFLSL